MNDSSSPIRLFATDIDDTVIGDAAGERRFYAAWDGLASEHRPLLVYNTGRTVAGTQRLVLERRLPAPEFIIAGLGTEIFDPLDGEATAEFLAHIGSGWNSAAVERIVQAIPGVHRQSAEFFNVYKSSWHWHRASAAEVARLQMRLENDGLEVTVCYTGDVFLDVLPRRAGKGNALAWLCRRIGVPLDTVLVAGASANNVSMFTLPGTRGILVGNAARDLFASARHFRPLVRQEKMADGVLAGLGHFAVIAGDPEPGVSASRGLSPVA